MKLKVSEAELLRDTLLYAIELLEDNDFKVTPDMFKSVRIIEQGLKAKESE